MDVFYNPVTLQAPGSLDLRHKHSEMTNLQMASFMSHLKGYIFIVLCVSLIENVLEN